MAKKLIHMDKNNAAAVKDDFTEWCSFIINEAIGIGILVLVTLFPLYFNPRGPFLHYISLQGSEPKIREIGRAHV